MIDTNIINVLATIFVAFGVVVGLFLVYAVFIKYGALSSKPRLSYPYPWERINDEEMQCLECELEFKSSNLEGRLLADGWPKKCPMCGACCGAC